MKDVLYAVGATFVTLLALTGCVDAAPTTLEPSEKIAADPGNSRGTGWYDTGDGRSVWCIYFGVNPGHSCDWANAHNPNDEEE